MLDERADDKDEEWFSQKALNLKSDGTLSCPMCFIPLSYHCQRYPTNSNETDMPSISISIVPSL